MTDEPIAGSASTEEPAGFEVSLVPKVNRPEYGDNMRRVAKRFTEVCQSDPELARALAYLANDTPFALMVAPKKKNRIMLA